MRLLLSSVLIRDGLPKIEFGQNTPPLKTPMEDRILVSEGQPQSYGTQYRRNEETQTFEFFPIKDFDSVNARRAAAALISIESCAKRNGIML